jgi:cellulose synthase/poly-beta-1,6-N-acetylglucosamine synthase-like glycosyltransferase
LQVGWFPLYTITEDYALSMELKAAGFKGRYLPEYLAVSRSTHTAVVHLWIASSMIQSAPQWQCI